MKHIKIFGLIMILIFIGCEEKNEKSSSGRDSYLESRNNDSVNDISKNKISEKAKIDIFNNVDLLREKLSKNGIGKLKGWRGDELGWLSSSEYYNFGSNSSINGMKNNIAYYLESDNSNYVTDLEITLNINNKKEEKKALDLFDEIIVKTFESIDIDLPTDALKKISNKKEFELKNDKYILKSEIDKSKIETLTLVIKSYLE